MKKQLVALAFLAVGYGGSAWLISLRTAGRKAYRNACHQSTSFHGAGI